MAHDIVCTCDRDALNRLKLVDARHNFTLITESLGEQEVSMLCVAVSRRIGHVDASGTEAELHLLDAEEDHGENDGLVLTSRTPDVDSDDNLALKVIELHTIAGSSPYVLGSR